MIEPKHNEKYIAILVNPISGKGKAAKIARWLSEQLTAKNIPYVLFNGEWPSSFSNFTELWIIGGDGTINYFLNHYKNNQLPVALFKGGTGNDFSWKLYGDISLQEQLELVLTAAAKPVDIAQCNDKLYANSLGIGFDGEVLRSINTIRLLGGHLGYLWVVIRKIFTFKEFTFSIQSINKKFSERFLLVIVNNSSRTGGGFMVSPQASVTDGKLDMILCKPLSLFKRLRYLPVIEKGKHLDLPFIYFHQEQEVHIECEKELFAQLDGELISGKSFDVKIVPGKLLVKY
jgi:diacylglycerol kinase (ATP)